MGGALLVLSCFVLLFLGVFGRFEMPVKQVVALDDLGNTLDVGGKEVGKIHVNNDGVTIVKDADGILRIGDICPAMSAQVSLNWDVATQSMQLLCGSTVIGSASVVACDPALDLAAAFWPASGAVDVPVGSSLNIVFPEVMAATTPNLISVMDASADPVLGTVSTVDNVTFVFTPDAPLSSDSVYTLVVSDAVKTGGPPSCPGVQGVQAASFTTVAAYPIYGYRDESMEFGYLDVSGTVYSWIPLAVQSERLNAIGIIDSQYAIAAQDNIDEFVLLDLATGLPSLLTRTNFSGIPDSDSLDVGTYDRINGIYYAKQEGASRLHSFSVDTVANEITFLSTVNLPNSMNVDDFTYLNGKLYGVEGNELRIWDIATSGYSTVSLTQGLNQSVGIWTTSGGELHVFPDNDPSLIYAVSLTGLVTQIGTVSPSSNWDNDKDDFGA